MVLLIRGHEADRRPSDRRVGVSVLGYYDVGVVVVQVVPQHLNDHGPDFVARVQELSGLVVFERFDEDVGHGADVVPFGVTGHDEQLVQLRKVEFGR